MPYWRLFYHLVWATAGREPLITPALQPVVQREIRHAARRAGIRVHAIGGTADHVHLAVSIPPTRSLAVVVGQLKGASSHAIRSGHDASFGWQGEYGVVSFAERSLPRVVAYIETQPERHATHRLLAPLEHLTEPDPASPSSSRL